MRSSSRALLTVPAGDSEPPGFPADPCRDPVMLQSTPLIADYIATGPSTTPSMRHLLSWRLDPEISDEVV